MSRNIKSWLDNTPKNYAKVKNKNSFLRFDLGVCPDAYNSGACKINNKELIKYPDASNHLIKKEIARHWKVKENQIVLGNGSDELIENIPRVFLNPKDKVIIPIPTFLRFEDACLRCESNNIFVKMNNLKFSNSTKDKIIRKILIEKPKMIWICNPSNVTGELVRREFIEDILKVAEESITIVDEALMDFVGEKNSCINLARKFNNLIVLRTFSKALGLASTRIGFAISNEKIIDILERLRLPFNVNIFAQKLAIKILKKNRIDNIIESTKRRRECLKKEFERIGLEFTDSDSNVFLVRHEKIDLFEELLKKKILVADFRNSRGLESKGFVRIAIRNDNENRILVSALRKIIRGWALEKSEKLKSQRQKSKKHFRGDKNG